LTDARTFMQNSSSFLSGAPVPFARLLTRAALIHGRVRIQGPLLVTTTQCSK
jgi:hypothetical protein